MKWSYLLEEGKEDLVSLSPQEHKMWISRLLKEFLGHSKRIVNATAEDILVVLSMENREELSKYSPESVVAISTGIEDKLVSLNIDPYSPLPVSYQIKEKTIFKDFIDARKMDKDRKRASDNLLFTLVFSKTFSIRPDKNTIKKSLSSNKALSATLKQLTVRLGKLGYKIKDGNLGVTPKDLIAIRFRGR